MIFATIGICVLQPNPHLYACIRSSTGYALFMATPGNDEPSAEEIANCLLAAENSLLHFPPTNTSSEGVAALKVHLEKLWRIYDHTDKTSDTADFLSRQIHAIQRRISEHQLKAQSKS